VATIISGWAHDHESFNDLSDASFAANYRRVYGTPVRWLAGDRGADSDDDQDSRVDIDIDQDIIIAAPFCMIGRSQSYFNGTPTVPSSQNSISEQWFDRRLRAAGDSRTGAHHIIGIANRWRAAGA